MKPNDFVVNEKLPAWGVGKVLENKGEGKFRVYFEFAGEKVMLGSFLSLTDTPANCGAWDESARKKPARKPRTIAQERTERAKTEGPRSRRKGDDQSTKTVRAERIPASAARSFADLEARFLRAFPAGFKDAGYLAGMRAPLHQVEQLYRERLSKEAIRMALDTGHYRELSISALRAMEETEYTPEQEQLRLKDAMQRDKAGREAYGRALFDLLYADEEQATRFENFSDILDDLDSLTWSMASYFLFLKNPWKNPFVRPQHLQAVSRVYGLEIGFSVRPNWRTYEAAMGLLERVSADLSTRPNLRPLDSFDAHCFLWKGIMG
jgi:hypothetical protein